MLLPDIINEISNLKDHAGHRSALEIFKMMQNNRHRFVQRMDKDEFDSLLKKFEELADMKPLETRTEKFRDDYNRAFNLLMYYLDRII